ncbi:Isochorismatase hydrolase [Armillaria solidipes]|uniref:Isochorismatase hydrolase n=1 Tax=Armillaria solidipes TaxID=1076256 RepID=A0A2H3BQQ5_9AGAR|nr:Isochorismatase hydrolase [Armillaria solidipes]
MSIRPESTIIFICDMQNKFRPAIHGYDQVIPTVNKMLKIAKIVGCEVLVTTQNSRALGPTDPAIDLESLGSLHVGTADKTLFSMLTPEVKDVLLSRPHIKTVVLMGIEAHICILQTALGLLDPTGGHNLKVYVLADGVASSHPTEMNIALDRLRHEGAVVSTSESAAFELIGDAKVEGFKAFSKVIKESKLPAVGGKM